MAIRSYHKARGDEARNVCIIPLSAHGTNPASAIMAGMKIVTVPSDDNGNIDFQILKQKAEENKDKCVFHLFSCQQYICFASLMYVMCQIRSLGCALHFRSSRMECIAKVKLKTCSEASLCLVLLS